MPVGRNFRDLTASVTRMATLANGERIGLHEVNAEIGDYNKFGILLKIKML
jgi:transcriptional regulatory protein RtcR